MIRAANVVITGVYFDIYQWPVIFWTFYLLLGPCLGYLASVIVGTGILVQFFALYFALYVYIVSFSASTLHFIHIHLHWIKLMLFRAYCTPIF